MRRNKSLVRYRVENIHVGVILESTLVLDSWHLAALRSYRAKVILMIFTVIFSRLVGWDWRQHSVTQGFHGSLDVPMLIGGPALSKVPSICPCGAVCVWWVMSDSPGDFWLI